LFIAGNLILVVDPLRSWSRRACIIKVAGSTGGCENDGLLRQVLGMHVLLRDQNNIRRIRWLIEDLPIDPTVCASTKFRELKAKNLWVGGNKYASETD
jgi:hypothetical protein